jgi:hypothetical protein
VLRIRFSGGRQFCASKSASSPSAKTLAARQDRQMNEKVIKIRSYNDIESLKMFILQKLNLVDHKKDYVTEFNERLKSYIHRNQNLKVVLQYDQDSLEKEIKFKMKLANIVDQPYPDNFEMGNPHNRWFFDGIPKTAEESKKQEVEFERIFQDKLKTLYYFLDEIRQLADQQICIKKS